MMQNSYSPNGQARWISVLSGVLRSVLYDHDNDDSASNGKTADDYTASYGYDLAGNRVRKTLDQGNDAADDQLIEYAYSGDDQLMSEQTDNYDPAVQHPGARDDLRGRLSRESGKVRGRFLRPYGAVARPLLVSQRLAPWATSCRRSAAPKADDLRGRMIRLDANGDTTYDQSGVATSHTSDDTTYAYDSDGNLVGQSGGGVSSTFVLDKNNLTGYSQTLETWTGGNSPSVTYVLGASVLGQNAGGVFSATKKVHVTIVTAEEKQNRGGLLTPCVLSGKGGWHVDATWMPPLLRSI